jgi:hypothetical protein
LELGFKLRANTFSHSHQLFFVKGFFKIGSRGKFPGCLRTTKCLISAFWAARISVQLPSNFYSLLFPSFDSHQA